MCHSCFQNTCIYMHAMMEFDEDDQLSCDEASTSQPNNGSTRKGKGFSSEQRATLNVFYDNGMKGTGLKHRLLIESASKEAKATPSRFLVSHFIDLKRARGREAHYSLP